ncbi:Glycosyl transferase family 2 [Roseovarius litoreus]|uniref:Glycosyl transferase family 2 n=1 Tax=Roseovarius litoreus TaxID=1155722 RepID=A0A1M7KE00_9RHOB|nr:glycosyltransferase family 92 protein [Roseovarius litoreus]SHM63538.1 Glycosyl transferase family 2 [Roseovarius litoreus]
MAANPKLFLSSFVLNESSDLLEWISYHKSIGASDIHIFVGSKSDGERPLLDALADAGVVTLQPVPVDPETSEEMRNSALRAATLEARQSGGYGLFLAPDEYLRITAKGGTVQALMKACKDADVLCAPVLEFGTGGRHKHMPGPVLSTATHRAPLPDAVPECSFRSIVRLGLYPSRTPDMPTGPAQKPDPKWVNGSGKAMPRPYSRAAWSDAKGVIGTDKATILKLSAPSVETYLLRMNALPEKNRPDAATVAARLQGFAAMTEPDPGLASHSATIDTQIAALLALPGIAAAQETVCARERAALENLRMSEPVILAPAPAKQTTSPDEAMPDDTEADDGLGETPDSTPAQGPGLPAWFAEIHTSGDRQGFYTRLANHALVCIRRDDARLVVTFDNLSNVNDLSFTREPWAYKFVRDNNCSHLSVMARRKDWFRDPQLIEHLQTLAANGFFREFGKVFMTGTSMGGFAALAFASLAPGATIISFNPQTTLDETLVPWEKRFRMGRQRDWSLPFSDSAYEIDDIEKAFVLYDPFFEPDRRHVERLEGDNVHLLKSWCTGHFTPVFLRRANLLKPIMQHAIDNTLTPELFYSLYRARRGLPWYRKSLESYLQDRGRPELALRARSAFRKLRKQAAE